MVAYPASKRGSDMTEDKTISAAAGAGSGLKARILSGIIMGVVALYVLYTGGFIFVLVAALAAALATYEWGRMVLSLATMRPWVLPLASLLSAICVFLTAIAGNPASAFWIILFCAIGAYVSSGLRSFRLAFGFVYITTSIGIMAWIRMMPENGFYHVLTLLLIVWASDICAYFTGRHFGGPKLAPTISPKKTWSGFLGSSVGAGIAAGFLATPWASSVLHGTPMGGFGVTGYALIGFIFAMIGQVGDLFISLIKRHYGVKDTGTLIPGHGGILDRIDALLLVTLFFGPLVFLLS